MLSPHSALLITYSCSISSRLSHPTPLHPSCPIPSRHHPIHPTTSHSTLSYPIHPIHPIPSYTIHPISPIYPVLSHPPHPILHHPIWGRWSQPSLGDPGASQCFVSHFSPHHLSEAHRDTRAAPALHRLSVRLGEHLLGQTERMGRVPRAWGDTRRQLWLTQLGSSGT